MSSIPNDQNLKSLNDFKDLFLPFKKKLPTIKEALEELGLDENDISDLVEFSKAKAEQVKKLHSLRLSDDEIAAIYVYTTVMTEGTKKPYEYINEALSSPNKSEEIPKVKKFLALLLSGLRKLPRQFPSLYVLYRGINVAVPLPKNEEGIKAGGMEEDDTNKGYAVARGRASITPYIKGCEKTWWSFTSTTGTLSEGKKFTKEIVPKGLDGKPIKKPDSDGEHKKGTLFIITMAWGYDISIFSEHAREKEYLLEPERKFTIEGILETSDDITIQVKFNETPLVLEDIFPPKYTKATALELPINKEVKPPKDLTLTESWCNGAAFYWSKVPVKGYNDIDPDIVYQVGMKEKKLLGGGDIVPMNSSHDIPTEESPLMVGPLKAGVTYAAYIRVGTPEFYSPWSKNPVTFVTPKIERIEDIEIYNPYSDRVSIRWKEVSFCPQYHISYEVWYKNLSESKPEYMLAGITESIPYVHEYEKSDTSRYEYRVRGLIKAQTEKGEACHGEWSSLVYGGPVENVVVNDVKCEYSPVDECINISWSPVKSSAMSSSVMYVVSAHNTSKATAIYNGRGTSCTYKDIEFGGTYAFFVRAKIDQTLSKLEKPNAQITLPLKKNFPGDFRQKLNKSGVNNYFLDQNNPMIAVSKFTDKNSIAVVVADTVVPFEVPSSWSIRVHNITNTIFFGIAPVSIRSVTPTSLSLKYGWFIDPITGKYCVGTECTRNPPRVKVELSATNCNGVGGLNPGDVITMSFNPGNLSLSFSHNGVPLNNGMPIFTGIDPSKLILPAVMMMGDGSAVELLNGSSGNIPQFGVGSQFGGPENDSRFGSGSQLGPSGGDSQFGVLR